MTIKEVEEQTGITRANIRFYEKEGLLTPGRGSNNYREYGNDDVEHLRRIRVLRMMGGFCVPDQGTDGETAAVRRPYGQQGQAD